MITLGALAGGLAIAAGLMIAMFLQWTEVEMTGAALLRQIAAFAMILVVFGLACYFTLLFIALLTFGTGY